MHPIRTIVFLAAIAVNSGAYAQQCTPDDEENDISACSGLITGVEVSREKNEAWLWLGNLSCTRSLEAEETENGYLRLLVARANDARSSWAMVGVAAARTNSTATMTFSNSSHRILRLMPGAQTICPVK